MSVLPNPRNRENKEDRAKTRQLGITFFQNFSKNKTNDFNFWSYLVFLPKLSRYSH